MLTLQEPEAIIKLPSLPSLGLTKLHSSPRVARAVFFEDSLSAPGATVAVGDCAAGEEFEAMVEQPDLACQTEDFATAAIPPLLGFDAGTSKVFDQVSVKAKLCQTHSRERYTDGQALQILGTQLRV